MPNIVEIVLQVKEQGAAVIDKTTSAVGDLGKEAEKTSGGIGALGKTLVGLAVAAASLNVLKLIAANIMEAQEAAAQLDAAFKATGGTLGLTRQRLDDLATEMQRTTTYSDDLVKSSESILLTFDKVRGEAFERTVKAAADLGARLGTDLPSAVRMLGRALQEPEQGLTALRRAGIAFSDEQIKLVKGLSDTGRAAEAQNFILGEVERRFAGAAQAARNTLGGALAGLKNSFGDLFESTTQGTSGAVSAVNGLTNALANPKLKSAIDTLITGIATVAAKIIEVSTGLIGIFTKPLESEAQKLKSQIAQFEKLLEPKRNRAGIQATSPDDIVMGGGARGITRASLEKTVESLKQKLQLLPKAMDDFKASTESAIPVLGEMNDELQFYNVTAKKIIDENPWIKFYQDQQAEINDTNEAFQNMFNNFGDVADKAFDQADKAIQGHKDTFKTSAAELGAIMEGVWQGVGQSIQSTLSDALYNAEFSLRSLTDIFRRALADISAAIITSGIKDLLKDQFSTGSSGSGGSGIWGTVLSALFSTAAGGGMKYGPTLVGEDGPEIINAGTSGMKVWNQRQLGGIGGGQVNFAPSYNIGIQGARDDSEIYANVVQFVNQKSAKDQAEFMRMMQRNGMGRMR